MAALLPLLMAAAPAAITAFTVGAARGAGNEIGKATGQGIASIGGNMVDAAGNVVNQISSFGQPPSMGQQRMVYLAQQ